MIKKILKKLFPGLVAMRNRMINGWQHRRFQNQPIEQVFHAIYRDNHWHDRESVSGPGSTVQITSSIRAAIPSITAKYEIKTFLDIPCGDFNWMTQVPLKNVKYIGMDIVMELVQKNAKIYAYPDRSFDFGDITTSNLPQSDLIFCRDCLVHLCYNDIRKAIANIKRSGSLYILTTTFPNKTNYDIITGNWRPINLCAAPFNWPQPIEIVTENEKGESQDKAMGLWRLSDLK
jgi:SAM-dependent methyltransferase